MHISKSQWIPHQVRNDKYDETEALHFNKNEFTKEKIPRRSSSLTTTLSFFTVPSYTWRRQAC